LTPASPSSRTVTGRATDLLTEDDNLR
jgi:hypothetical protein